MRFRFRAAVVVLFSLGAAISCLGGPNHCLNPQPDLPSCGSADDDSASPSGGTSASGSAGAGNGAPGAAGSGFNVGDQDAGLPPEATAGSSGEFAGAGGDTSLEVAGDGSGGSAAGGGGASGASAGTGGASAGTGGASAGTGGASAGTGAAAGGFDEGP